MSSNRYIFEQLYVREVAKERENDFNHTVCTIFAVVCIPLAIFSHPAWIVVTVFIGLLHLLRSFFKSGFPKWTSATCKQACEFMLRVRENGKDRTQMPLACADSIMHLALSESCENKVDGSGVVIVQNMRFSCAGCKREAGSDVIAVWWKAKAAFKPAPQRDELLRKDGTCAKCGGSEGWFESRM